MSTVLPDYKGLWISDIKDAHCGTGGETRTPKVLPPVDFESTASTNSATPAAALALPRDGLRGQGND